MLDLSPAKLLIILIVGMVLLGPDKLPQVARQLGSGWRRLKAFTEKVDQDVRQSIPDLPSTRDLARYARSPAALLEELARMDPAEELVEDRAAEQSLGDEGEGGAEGADWPEDPAATAVAPQRLVIPDDPAMN